MTTQRWKFGGLLLAAMLVLASCEGNPLAPDGDSDDDSTVDGRQDQVVTVTVIIHTHDANDGGDDSGQPNRPPVLVQPSAQTSVAGQAASLTVVANDADGDTLSWIAGGLPRGLSMNGASGIISGTITTSSASDSPFNVFVSVSDGLLSDSANFVWTVTP